MFTCGPAFFGTKTVTDPYWSDVLLLCNGQATITTDSSSFNNTLTLPYSGTLNASVPLFGFNTYYVDALWIPQSFFAGKFGSNEWCVDFWYYPVFGGVISNGTFSQVGGWLLKRTSTRALFNQVNVNSSPYTGNTINGIFTLNQWSFVSLSRDKSDPSVDKIKAYVNGSLVYTSADIPKSGITNYWGITDGVIMTNLYQSPGYFSNYRITRNHARYYANYSVPTAPFPTS